MPATASILALLAVTALAFTVEGALGFGATIVAVTLGAFVVPIHELLPVFVPLNMILSASLVARGRRHVDLRFLLWRALPLMAVGLPLGMIAVRVVDAAAAARVLGAFVVVLAAFELVRRPLPLPSPVLLLLGGVVHGAFGTGGPLAVAAAGRTLDDKARFRATLSALWLGLNVVLVAGFAVDGRLTPASAGTSLLLAGGLLAGMVLGEVLHRRVPARAFRVAVWIGLAVAGLALVAR